MRNLAFFSQIEQKSLKEAERKKTRWLLQEELSKFERNEAWGLVSR